MPAFQETLEAARITSEISFRCKKTAPVSRSGLKLVFLKD